MEAFFTVRKSRDESGSTHVLEAVIIATIMLSALAFVATFQTPPEGSSSTRGLLSQDAADALSILYDTPVSNGGLGDNLLSVDLAKCLQGDCSDLSSKLSGLLPQGASYALYVSNGYDTFPVYVTKSPPGEAVTARRLLEPHWSYTFTGSAMTNINNFTDPALIYSLPVFNSNVVSPGGSPLKIIVEGVRSSDQASYVLEGFYTTQAAAASDVLQVPALSMNFMVNRTLWEKPGETLDTNASTPGANAGYYPGGFWDRYAEVLNASSGWPSNQSVRFDVNLSETAGVSVPVGTEITIDVPRGWNASGWNNASWQVLQNATDWNASSSGSQVIAKLLTPINARALNFTFNATYHGDLLKYYTFHASLAKGASAEANVVVLADGYGDATQTFLVPSVKMSVPRPMGAAAKTTWSLAVNIPYTAQNGAQASKQGVNGFDVDKAQLSPYVSTDPTRPNAGLTTDLAAGTPINITSIKIIEQDGANIFKDVKPLRISEGTWVNLGNQLVWAGRHSTWNGTLNLTFEVTANGTAGAQASRAIIVPPVTFNPWEGRLVDQLSPGLYRQGFLPNNTTGQNYPVKLQGYAPNVINVTTPLLHDYTSNSVYRGQPLAGRGNYTANQLSPVHDSIYGSNVNVDKRTVPIGGQVVITADVQSLLYALSQAGEAAGVNLTLYPPWTGDAHAPIWSQSNLDSTVVSSSYTALTMLDVNGDGKPDAIMGTSQGRVFALDALTGTRLQGNAFVAPVLKGNAAYAAINKLATINLWGQNYIVAATDASSGVYILNSTFGVAWSWDKASADPRPVVQMDVQTDYTGDGQPDIALALDDSTVWVLSATPSSNVLQQLAPSSSVTPFYKAQGTPSALVSVPHLGLAKTPGLAVSLLNKPGPATQIEVTQSNDPVYYLNHLPQFSTKVPRAGLDGVDGGGRVQWTFTGGPVTTARNYGDLNGDGANEIVAGSSAGFVIMLNGSKAAPPFSTTALIGGSQVTDGKSPTILDSIMATADGAVAYTHDRWNTMSCLTCYSALPAVRGVSLNSSGSGWAVGPNALLYNTTYDTTLESANMLPLAAYSITEDGLNFDRNLAPVDYNDVYFRFGAPPVGDEGWVIGTPPKTCALAAPLNTVCPEAFLMHTLDSGRTWTKLGASSGTMVGSGASMVRANLTHINFTTPTLGWITGSNGTLLRWKDVGAGQLWKNVAPAGTSSTFTDISCATGANRVCYLGSDDNRLWRTENGEATPIVWTEMTQYLAGRLATNGIHALGVVNDSIAYMGSTNVILATWNKGYNWSALPMSYVSNDITRLNLFADGTGYGWGGNPTNGAMFFAAAYNGNATYQTTDLLPDHPLSGPAPRVYSVDITTAASTTQPAALYWNASTDGVHWIPASVTQVPRVKHAPQPAGVQISVPTKFMTAVLDDAANGSVPANALYLRATFNTSPDAPFQTAQIQGIDLTVHYRTSADGYGASHVPDGVFSLDLKADAKIDATASSVTWDASLAEISSRQAGKSWATNVSGAVNDVQTNFDATGDGRNDVWVATGPVLSGSSPDYLVYAGTDEAKFIKSDDRVYLIDGTTGAILQNTTTLAGSIASIRLVDENNDGYVDTLYAMTDPTSQEGSTGTRIYAFNATTLKPLPSLDPRSTDGAWKVYVSDGAAVAMEVGKIASGSMAVVATKTSSAATGALPSVVVAVPRVLMANLWHIETDARGQYVIQKNIPTNWFFGPYVTEIRVDWQDKVTGLDPATGVSQAYTVVQSARFYDYFMVTPPAAVSPASPVYDVQLVAWFDDWR